MSPSIEVPACPGARWSTSDRGHRGVPARRPATARRSPSRSPRRGIPSRGAHRSPAGRSSFLGATRSAIRSRARSPCFMSARLVRGSPLSATIAEGGAQVHLLPIGLASPPGADRGRSPGFGSISASPAEWIQDSLPWCQLDQPDQAVVGGSATSPRRRSARLRQRRRRARVEGADEPSGRRCRRSGSSSFRAGVEVLASGDPARAMSAAARIPLGHRRAVARGRLSLEMLSGDQRASRGSARSTATARGLGARPLVSLPTACLDQCGDLNFPGLLTACSQDWSGLEEHGEGHGQGPATLLGLSAQLPDGEVRGPFRFGARRCSTMPPASTTEDQHHLTTSSARHPGSDRPPAVSRARHPCGGQGIADVLVNGELGCCVQGLDVCRAASCAFHSPHLPFIVFGP